MHPTNKRRNQQTRSTPNQPYEKNTPTRNQKSAPSVQIGVKSLSTQSRKSGVDPVSLCYTRSTGDNMRLSSRRGMQIVVATQAVLLIAAVGVIHSQQAQTQRFPQFDNEDVKVWRSVVLPNQPLTMHRHEHPRVIIPLRGGLMKIVEQSGKTEQHPMGRRPRLLASSQRTKHHARRRQRWQRTHRSHGRRTPKREIGSARRAILLVNATAIPIEERRTKSLPTKRFRQRISPGATVGTPPHSQEPGSAVVREKRR